MLQAPGLHHGVIEAASEDRPRSDTASVIELENGDLMVAYHSNVKGLADDFCPLAIWSKVSHDKGKTWNNRRLLVDITEGDINVQAPGLLRLNNGDILMNCLREHNPSSSTMLVFKSTDEGQLFEQIATVWKKSDGVLLQGGASSLVLLDSGRILLPFHGGAGHQHDQKNSAWCYFSDDQGYSWELSKEIQVAGRGAMEPSVAQLSNGLLVMSLRTDQGGPFICTSEDEGVTWTEPVFSGLEGSQACTALRRIPGSDLLAMFFDSAEYQPGHHHQGERSPFSIAVSDDAGKSWEIIEDLLNGPHEYLNQDCYFTADGTAVVTVGYVQTPWARDLMNLLSIVIEPQWWSKNILH